MFKTRQYLLPLVLLTTITLSSSNVLPILSINKVDSDSLLDDQDGDNTFNNRQTRINPNIFYKVFIGTSKDNLPKKSQVSRLKYLENDNNPDRKTFNGLIENDDNYNDEGFRKEQWHNYPRQLDRLNKKLYFYKILEKILDTDDRQKRGDTTQHDVFQYSSDDILGNFGPDVIAGPLLILKIRLAYLNNNLKNRESDKYTYTYSDPLDLTSENDETTTDENALLENDDKSVLKIKRNEKLTNADTEFLENSSNERKSVKKRIFSLWSRLQSLSQRGHQLHHRRHMYAFYGLPDGGTDGGGTLTAETRAMMRPPGSPLRWG